MKEMDCTNCANAEKIGVNSYKCVNNGIRSMNLSGDVALCSGFEKKEAEEK